MDDQSLVPNRGTFCYVFTPIRHFFWLSLFSLPLCTFFGHFLSNPPSKIRPGGTPAQRASIATQCCSPAGPPSLRDGFLRGGYKNPYTLFEVYNIDPVVTSNLFILRQIPDNILSAGHNLVLSRVAPLLFSTVVRAGVSV